MFNGTIQISKMPKFKSTFSNITVLYLTLTFLTSNVFGQNTTKFIEPNISFSYDSSKLKIETRYSNSYYETESYDFTPTFDTINKVRINVSANYPIENPKSLELKK